MIYQKTLTVVHGSSPLYPQRDILFVTYGVIIKLEVHFPPGPSGLVGIQIFDATNQIYPSTLDEWFRGDNILLSYVEQYKKYTAPFQLDIHSYNIDDAYDHTVIVRVQMASSIEEIAAVLPSGQTNMIVSAFAEILGKEQGKKAGILENALAFLRKAK